MSRRGRRSTEFAAPVRPCYDGNVLTVGVAQLVERWIVVPVAEGSNPSTHPKENRVLARDVSRDRIANFIAIITSYLTLLSLAARTAFRAAAYFSSVSEALLISPSSTMS